MIFQHDRCPTRRILIVFFDAHSSAGLDTKLPPKIKTHVEPNILVVSAGCYKVCSVREGKRQREGETKSEREGRGETERERDIENEVERQKDRDRDTGRD